MSPTYEEEDIRSFKAFNEGHQSLAVRLSASGDPVGIAVFLAGDLDTGTSTDFLKTATRLIPRAAAKGAFLIDLGDLRYISSTGVGALATLMTESEKRSVPFYLASVHSRAQSIFEALGLWSFFRVLPSLSEEA